MFGVWEHVYRPYTLGFVVVLFQPVHIPGQGFRIAGYINPGDDIPLLICTEGCMDFVSVMIRFIHTGNRMDFTVFPHETSDSCFLFLQLFFICYTLILAATAAFLQWARFHLCHLFSPKYFIASLHINGTQISILTYTNIVIAKVPADIKARPAADFFVSFSLRNTAEKATVINILILSIGTTTLTTPFWIA